jgi:hypothetical protein
MEDLNPTVRRHPRTLSEAFPRDASYAEWIHYSPRAVASWVYPTVAIFAFIVVLLFLLARALCTT